MKQTFQEHNMQNEEIEVKNYICSNCGEMTDYSENKQISHNGGCSTTACLIIFGLLLLPLFGIGLILLIAALFVPMGNKTIKANLCPHCHSENVLLPITTVRGKELLRQYHNIEYPVDETKISDNVANISIYKKIKKQFPPYAIIITILCIVFWIIIFAILN